MPAITATEAADLFRNEPDRHLRVGTGPSAPEVAYRRVGEGPDVLFVHGWPVTGATFRTLLPHLSEHVTCHVIDLPGTGWSRFDTDTPLSLDGHIEAVRRVVDELALASVAVVGHDSGGMIARHAMAGDPRLRALGLLNTEQPQGLSRRFRQFLAARRLPGFGPAFGWIVGQPALRRLPLVLGDAFSDPAFIDGEFDEFFLQPLHTDKALLDASARLFASFDIERHVKTLGQVHSRIRVPVKLVWGDQDPFLPVDWAREMVSTFADAEIDVIEGAGLFVHEERPAEVAASLLPVLQHPAERVLPGE